MSGRGIVGGGVFRSELIEANARTSDPTNPRVGDWWIRSDVQPSVDGATTVAALRIQGTGGVLEVPFFDAAEESNLGADVYVGERFRFDDGAVGFIAETDQGGAKGSPRVVTPTGAEYQAHDALELSAIPDSGGVLRYDFEDDSDTSVAIDSWNNNDGTITGASYTSTAQIGSLALDLAGSGYVDAGTVLQSAPFSFSIWIYPRDWSAQRFQYVASAEDGDLNSWLFRSDTDESTPFEFMIKDGGGASYVVRSSHPPENSFTMVTATYGTDGTLTLYKNDNQADQTTGADGSLPASSANTLIGESEGFSGRIMDGIVDDGRGYSKELTSTEVSNLYSTGSIDG